MRELKIPCYDAELLSEPERGDGVCFDGGDRDELSPPSETLDRGDDERVESTCILSSRSPGEGIDESVAMGGSAIDPPLLPCETPTGRGCGGSTAGSDGLGGNGS